MELFGGGDPQIWTKANRFVRKLLRAEGELAEATMAEEATKKSLLEYREGSVVLADLIVEYQKGYK